MATQRVKRVLLVGGGIGGLTAAIGLRRAGFDAVVFESAKELQQIQVGTAIDLWPNATNILRSLCVLDQVAAVGSRVTHFEFQTWRGLPLSSWDIEGMERKYGGPTIGVSRADLHPVLVNALSDGVLHLNSECTGCSQDTGGVTARFRDGREERGDILIGSDGARSTVRRLLGIDLQMKYTGYSYWNATIPDDRQYLEPGRLRVLWGPGARYRMLHVGGERLYWMGIFNAPEGASDPPDQLMQSIRDRFKGWCPPTETLIEATDATTIKRADHYYATPVKSWGTGRITLLGDAAHPITFNVGQGACQAIEDGAVLAKCLMAEDDPVVALRRYEILRMPRTARIQRLARGMGSISKWHNPLMVELRNRIMIRTMNGPILRRQDGTLGYQP